MVHRISALLFILLLAGPTAAGGFDAATVHRLEQALAAVNLSVADLGWDKRPIDDDFRLACVNDALDHPLTLASWAERAEAEFDADPAASAARAAAKWLDVGDAGPSEVKAAEFDRAATR